MSKNGDFQGIMPPKLNFHLSFTPIYREKIFGHFCMQKKS